MNTNKQNVALKSMNPRNIYPKVDAAKECTDTTGPPRLINIPN